MAPPVLNTVSPSTSPTQSSAGVNNDSTTSTTADELRYKTSSSTQQNTVDYSTSTTAATSTTATGVDSSSPPAPLTGATTIPAAPTVVVNHGSSSEFQLRYFNSTTEPPVAVNVSRSDDDDDDDVIAAISVGDSSTEEVTSLAVETGEDVATMTTTKTTANAIGEASLTSKSQISLSSADLTSPNLTEAFSSSEPNNAGNILVNSTTDNFETTDGINSPTTQPPSPPSSSSSRTVSTSNSPRTTMTSVSSTLRHFRYQSRPDNTTQRNPVVEFDHVTVIGNQSASATTTSAAIGEDTMIGRSGNVVGSLHPSSVGPYSVGLAAGRLGVVCAVVGILMLVVVPVVSVVACRLNKNANASRRHRRRRHHRKSTMNVEDDDDDDGDIENRKSLLFGRCWRKRRRSDSGGTGGRGGGGYDDDEDESGYFRDAGLIDTSPDVVLAAAMMAAGSKSRRQSPAVKRNYRSAAESELLERLHHHHPLYTTPGDSGDQRSNPCWSCPATGDDWGTAPSPLLSVAVGGGTPSPRRLADLLGSRGGNGGGVARGKVAAALCASSPAGRRRCRVYDVVPDPPPPPLPPRRDRKCPTGKTSSLRDDLFADKRQLYGFLMRGRPPTASIRKRPLPRIPCDVVRSTPLLGSASPSVAYRCSTTSSSATAADDDDGGPPLSTPPPGGCSSSQQLQRRRYPLMGRSSLMIESSLRRTATSSPSASVGIAAADNDVTAATETETLWPASPVEILRQTQAEETRQLRQNTFV